MSKTSIPKVPDGAEEAHQLYLNLMAELRIRLFAIDDMTTSVANSQIPGQVVLENCSLQLRMCCEIMAIACLVAHGDIEAARSRQFMKAYEPGKIVTWMTELHPNFFPIPGHRNVLPDGGFEFVKIDPSKPPLNKEDLGKLWGLLGGRLHKDSLKRLLSDKTPRKIHFPEITAWVERFRDLLDQHRIANFNNKVHLINITNMRNRTGPITGVISISN